MHTLVRAVVLVLASAGFGLVASFVADPAAGAPIGAGLLAFAAAVVLSFIWALLDAGSLPLGRVVARWLAVAVLYAMAMVAIVRALDPGDFDLSVYLRDLPATGLFDAVLVFVPAVIGAFIGAAVARARRTVPGERGCRGDGIRTALRATTAGPR